MKKIFSFAAVLFAAMTINATVYDFTTITSETDYTITKATKNASESNESKIVYDIKGGDVLEMYLNAVPNVKFSITNSSDKPKAFVVNLGEGNASIEFGGKNGIITITNVAISENIIVTAAAKGGNEGILTIVDGAVGESEVKFPKKDSEGADEKGYVWKDAEYMAIATTVTLKETGGGIRVTKIVVGDTSSAVENIEGTTAKATKVIENGQIYILKNGVKYNVLGAQVAE